MTKAYLALDNYISETFSLDKDHLYILNESSAIELNFEHLININIIKQLSDEEALYMYNQNNRNI